MKEVILIPEERIRVVKDKRARETIENRLSVKLSFSDNAVEVEGEGLEAYQAKTIIKAITRGFSPARAFRLFDENEQLEMIELKDFTERKAKIIKSRVIGTGGKTRFLIEECSGAAVSVYGRTISIIGTYEQIQIAKEAIHMIIHGAMHATVYKFLQRSRL